MATFLTLLVLILIEKGLRTDAAQHINTRFNIGGLFSDQHLKNTRRAFENMATTSTMKVYRGRTIYPSVTDSYSMAMEVCKSTSNNKGIAALIDVRPTNGICDNTCLLCNRLKVCHLALGWQPTDTLVEDSFTFSYYPPPELTSKAYATLIKELAWDKFTIFYEDEGSFVRLQEIINSWPHDKDPILYKKLDPAGDNREIFKYVIKEAHMTHHVLDCEVDNIVGYMNEIIQVENTTMYQSFILTSLDAHTVNLKDVDTLRANISTMHVTNANDVRWQDIGINSGPGIMVETALLADALNHLEKAVRLMQSKRLAGNDGDEAQSQTFDHPPALCYKESKADYEGIAWSSGDDLKAALIETSSNGFTGNVEFDVYGKRTNLRLHYSKFSSDGSFMYTGHWDSTTNAIEIENKVEDRSSHWKDGVIRVVSKTGLPYFDIVTENGTERTLGYAVDLIEAIFKKINEKNGTDFQPIIQKVADNQYGSPSEITKKWNGLVGELIEHRAELAICDLSITSQRNSVVDFSLPFMTTGISMLFRVPDPDIPDMFSFINPLSLDVWLYLATTYIIVSFILLICARMSQDDWVNPHPCNRNPDNLQNIWSLYNCMWLTMGSIMTQGCDIIPRGIGSRWVTGIWYFFALIVTASYTANMSTFLSNSRRSNDIKDVKDLAAQNKVIPGAVLNASTYKFFEESNEEIYQKVWSMMSSAKPTVFTSDNKEGMERVKTGKGNYAFFMESTAIEYFTERDCDLMMVGPELDSKEYGIAMPRNFPLKGLVNDAILALQEEGELTRLKNKWWQPENDPGKCQNKDDESDSGSLEMKNTSGIFLVLGVGAVLGLLVSVVDFMLHAQKISAKEKVTFKEALASEWRASLNPRALQKSVAPPRSAQPSESPSSRRRERSQSRAVSVLRAASSFINFDEIY